MKYMNNLLTIICLSTVCLFACKANKEVTGKDDNQPTNSTITATIVDTDDCKYELIEGEGKITRMNFSNPENVVIQFDFLPKKDSGLAPIQAQAFNVYGVGKYPSKSWCEENGVEQGVILKVNLYRLTDDSDIEYCSEMVFSFVDFEEKGWR